ncbi:MAG: o-succinylbenzoate synthase [Candidatus Nanopelagicales bacterium]
MPDDPGLRALLAAAVPFALPLRHRFRGIELREGVLVSGPSGWGEFAPFDDYTDAAASRWLDCAIEAAFGQWPQPVRDRVEVNAIIPAVGADAAAVLARAAVSGTGCRVVKVKVGDADLAADEARVATVRDVLDTLLGRGRGGIRVDANGAWSEDAAATALRRLAAYGLEYVEQPCRTAGETARLRRRVDVLVAVDELVRHADDPGTVRLRDVADLAILKAAPLGGVLACLRLADALDVPVVVSGSMDSSVGLDAGIALAAALDDLPFSCGLGTGALLASDVVDAPRLAEGGTLAAGRTAPDLPALLAARDRLGDERAAWWRARLAAAWQAGSRARMGHLVQA